jgi:hypothetical protein
MKKLLLVLTFLFVASAAWAQPPGPGGGGGGGVASSVTVTEISAGDNNIGNVDVLTLPADPLGANADAVVAAGAAGSMSAKLRRITQGLEDLKSLLVLAAGNNNIGDVDVATIAAGDNNIGNVDIVSAPAIAAGANLIGRVQIDANTANGGDLFSYTSVAAAESEHAVKATPGTLFSIAATNHAAAAAFLRCENDTAANTAPGSETPELDIEIPGNTAGAGIVIPFPVGYTFSNALTCWIVTGEAQSDVAEVAADDVKIIYNFK